MGNFAVLQKLDAGYFGQGVYLTMDPEYAIEEYGRRVFGLTRVPLLVCVVVVGNTLPVIPYLHPVRLEPTQFRRVASPPGPCDMVGQCAARKVVRRCAQVIESPHTPDGFLGKAIVGKADSHVARVARDAAANGGDTDPLPCLPARWAAVRSFSEIVVRDESQVLPLGYVVVDD